MAFLRKLFSRLIRDARRAAMFLYNFAETTLQPRPEVGAREIELGQTLIQRLTSLTAVGGSQFWQKQCNDLAECAKSRDPIAFFSWPPIKATMFHGTTKSTLEQWRLLKASKDWSEWKKAMRRPNYGLAPP